MEKNPDYFVSLTDKEKKEFSHWLILSWLSMDSNLIELVAFLWQDGYYDKIPSDIFYRLLISIIPKSNQKLIWLKKSKKVNSKLMELISQWFKISHRESLEYLNLFMLTDGGIQEVGRILIGSGLSESEAEELLIGKD